MLTRGHLKDILADYSNSIALDIAGCRLKEGRPKFGQELDVDLLKLRASADTFEWLGSPRPARLVLKLKAGEDYMAFKYARFVTQTIEVCQRVATEREFEQKVVA